MEETNKLPTLKQRERQIITETLESVNWHITQAAQILGLSRAGLYSKLKCHGIEIPRAKAGNGQ